MLVCKKILLITCLFHAKKYCTVLLTLTLLRNKHFNIYWIYDIILNIGGQEGARQLRDISEQLEAALFTINSGQVLSESEVSA